jgi:hypothetical protein
MAKYEKLTDWLKNPQRLMMTRLMMTFKEIEQIIEEHLPESAHRYRAWWGTEIGALTGAEPSQCRAWRDAGWEVESADLKAEEVTFRKTSAAEIRKPRNVF